MRGGLHLFDFSLAYCYFTQGKNPNRNFLSFGFQDRPEFSVWKVTHLLSIEWWRCFVLFWGGLFEGGFLQNYWGVFPGFYVLQVINLISFIYSYLISHSFTWDPCASQVKTYTLYIHLDIIMPNTKAPGFCFPSLYWNLVNEFRGSWCEPMWRYCLSSGISFVLVHVLAEFKNQGKFLTARVSPKCSMCLLRHRWALSSLGSMWFW